MNATTVAVDLAKSVFELAVADEHWKVLERARLTRRQFERWFDNRAVRRVVMEACATAHHWARTLRARGIEVLLVPAQYVRAYVKRDKTDAADALALLEAARASDITPVGVKSVEQQGLQALHRLRSGLDVNAHAAHQHAARVLPGVRHGGVGRGSQRSSPDRAAPGR